MRLTGEMVRSAGRLAALHGLRAYDAVHLSTALSVARGTPEACALLTYDSELAAAATQEGLTLAE